MRRPTPGNNHEIVKLIQEYQETDSGDIQLQLVKRYKDLVHSLAKKFSKGMGYDEDLFQVGMLGLLAALRRFDSNVGNNFEAFAIPTIIGEIKRYIRDKTWSVQVPRRIKEIGIKINKAIEILTIKYERSPKIEEVARFLSVTEEEVLEALEMGRSYHALSIDRTIESDQDEVGLTLLDLIGKKEDGYEQINQNLLIERLLSIVNEKESRILQFVFFEELSQREVGKRLGISQMHVSRIQRKALEKIRKSLEKEMFGHF